MNRKQMSFIILSALLCMTAFGFLEGFKTGESSALGVTFDAPLAYNCHFVTPTDGETVSGTYLIDFYGDYSGYSLYRVRIRLYKGSTALTSYYDMTSVGGGHWQINWNTENYDDGTGYRLRAVAYRSSYRYTNVYCNDLTVDNEGGSPPSPPPGPGELRSGVTAHSSLGGTGQTEMWYIDVPSGITTMRTVLTCGSADFDVYGRRGAEPTTSTYDWRGYTSGGEDVTINNPGSGRWYIMVRSYSGSGNYDLTCTLAEGPSPGEGEKIAVFFWASDAGAQWVIDKYTTILRGEGYTKFFSFRNSYSPSSDCSSVDAYEDSQDTIFVYVFGHGNNNGQHSYTAFRPSGSIVYSNQFRGWMDNWEAPRKCIFTESCHSGDWSDDFRASPYLAMSTSDETHVSYAVGTLPNEGKMSKYFFERVDAGYNAVDAWSYARNYVTNQYPKIADYSTYVWFT